MATTLLVHCDACGERITSDRTALKILCGRLRGREPIDLCSTCLDELEAFLGKPPGRKPPRAAKPADNLPPTVTARAPRRRSAPARATT